MSDKNGATQDDTKKKLSIWYPKKKTSIPIEIVIGERLEQLAPVSDFYCIYRVPERLRCLNPDVYTPKVVSVGPLHRGRKTLQYMEEYKYRYLQHFLDRTEESLEYYIQKVRLQEAELRAHYAEPIELSSDDFVTIILVDSAFIIELLLKIHFAEAYRGDRGDRIMSYTNLLSDISLDLMLLENQLPLFLLEDLYDPEKARVREKLSIVQLSCKLFRLRLGEIGVDYDLVAVNSSEVKGVHFLDIARNLCLPAEKPQVKGSHNTAAIDAPSITELHRAGVKLKVRSTRNLFSIRFRNGILEIPKVNISGDTELILRNLAAYEQCCYSNARITEYLGILSSFVNTPKDVELLVKYGIVTNYLGDSSEACILINSLCKGLYSDYNDLYFATLYENLHMHCKTPWNERKASWNEWKASFRQKYLHTTWGIVSVVAAAFLIILTTIQTVCALVSL